VVEGKTHLKITTLQAGYCTCPEHLAIRGGSWRSLPFPAMFALLEHPSFGPMLFDTGYSYRFFEETRSFPNLIYRWLTPVNLREEQLAVNQLAAIHLQPSDISHIFISHFHADHIAALADFDTARYIYLPQAYEAVRSLRGLRALKSAFLSGLIPGDFESRSHPVNMDQRCALPPEYAPFTVGYDLLGDASLLAVELPGHAAGQMGIIARSEINDQDQTFFFVADAAWLVRSINDDLPPHALANLFFTDPKAYRGTLSGLHKVKVNHPNFHIIPSHCAETLAGTPAQ
jgi:glyoxylase-like metal-dependent hydrolase (beta-lactamase superfamily II)